VTLVALQRASMQLPLVHGARCVRVTIGFVTNIAMDFGTFGPPVCLAVLTSTLPRYRLTAPHAMPHAG